MSKRDRVDGLPPLGFVIGDWVSTGHRVIGHWSSPTPPPRTFGLAGGRIFPKITPVIVFLRLVGLLNVAAWFGAVIFFTAGAAPAFFSADMKALLGEQNYPAFSGRLAMILVGRYFLFHYWCGTIALVHQLAERFYLGKPLQRLNFGLLIGVCSLGLIEGLWLQPHLKRLHAIEYGRGYSPAQQAQARKAFGPWHGASRSLNLLVLAGLGVYLWRMTNPGNGARFVPSGKFRS